MLFLRLLESGVKLGLFRVSLTNKQKDENIIVNCMMCSIIVLLWTGYRSVHVQVDLNQVRVRLDAMST
jgi:hypothetical protein